ncbi:Protocadherin Fat 2 [Galemys pyrenaicus]|uniref:Protocadherin Fat 2 n=1 Tax=Galemys pyrenaicus TaxID=202257 RepID=A0A8J5ZSD8_GALPY|nr:Protocadherin Fat 2 [Galemys pyrenaicus]
MVFTFLGLAVFWLHAATCEKPPEGTGPPPAWRFTHPLYNATIYENSAPKTYVESLVPMGVRLAAPGGAVRFHIVSGDAAGVFKAEEQVVGDFCFLRLRTRSGSAALLNREVQASYDLEVQALAPAQPRGARAWVRVQVLDRDDLRPLFSPPSYRVTISEDTPPRTPICRLTATDADLGRNAAFYYAWRAQPPAFALHPTSGVVTVARRLNATWRGRHELQVLAVERAGRRPEGTGPGTLAPLLIHVEPAPRRAPAIVSVRVAPPGGGEEAAYATVTVEAGGSGAQVDALDIVGGDPGRLFRAVGSYARSGEFRLVAVRDVDWLQHPHGLNLSLQARSSGQPPSPVRAFHLPPWTLAPLAFEQAEYRVRLSECAPPGSRVALVRAGRGPPGLRYLLGPGPEAAGFRLDERTGLLTTSRLLDVRARAQHRLLVRTIPGLASAMVTVDLVDCNDHAPAFGRPSYEGAFDENVPPGTSVLAVAATDLDLGENGRLSYSIAGPGPVPFAIDPDRGVISTSAPMDYELMQRIYTFRVRASDWGSPFRQEKEVSVSLRLRNLNDNTPLFEAVNCTGSVHPDWPVGKPLVTLSAIDVDELQNLKYEFVGGNELGLFDLHPLSGVVSLKRALPDRPANYTLRVTAWDGEHRAPPTTLRLAVVWDARLAVPVTCRPTGALALFTRAVLHSAGLGSLGPHDQDALPLGAYQANRHTPQFADRSPQAVAVPELAALHTPLARLEASDPDVGASGHLVYVIAHGNEEGRFDIGLETGLLTVAAPLDYEATRSYVLNVTASDLGTPRKSCWRLLTVAVLDCNDNAPRFPPGGFQLTVPEDTGVGATVAELSAGDADSEDNGRVRYSLLSPTDKFSLHPLTGALVVTGPLDRESQPRHVLQVEARDQPQAGPQLFSVADLVVTLQDANDNAPRCVPALSRLQAPEDLPLGTVLTFLDATDPDLGAAGEVRFALLDDARGTFHLDPETGALSLRGALDFESRAAYNLSVWARDGGQPRPHRTLCHVEVTVLDVNENLHPPRFGAFVHRAQVWENSPAGTPVLAVVALDEDGGLDGEVQYHLRAGSGLAAFGIDQDTGMIHTLAVLDREAASSYWLTVLAVDRGSRPLSSATEVYIEVTDVNDSPPRMSRPVFYPCVPEDAPPHSSVLQLDATDPDSSSQGRLTFNITGGNQQGLFALHPLTGLLSTARQLDREEKDEYVLEVAVLDHGEPPLWSVSRVVVCVLDVNDHAPAFPHKLFSVRLPESVAAPGPVYRLVAADADAGPNGVLTYSIEEGGEGAFRIDPASGLVSALGSFRAGEYNILTVKATDGGQPALSASVRLHVEWAPRPQPSSAPLAFDEPHYSFTVMETDPVSHMVGVLGVEGCPGLCWFSITGGDPDMDFDVEKTTGSILIARPLDARRRLSYNLTVEVTDGSRAIATQVHVAMIANVNRHRPQFLKAHYEVRVPQDTPPGVELLQVQASDPDQGKALVYTIQGSQDPGSASLFQLDPGSGVLVTVGKLDLGPGPTQHTLTVMVRDQEMPTKRNFVWVSVRVEPANRHRPRFTQPRYEASVPVDTVPGTELLQVRATDGDQGASGEVHYTLLKGNSDGFFDVDALLGTVTLAWTPQQAQQGQYMLTVKAEDWGSPPGHDLTTVVIHVHPSDSSAPTFSEAEYFVEIPESIPAGSPILRVAATSSSGVTYELREGNKEGVFSMNTYSGLISTCKALDHEKVSSYQLKIRGSSLVGASADVSVLVSIVDENDHAPEFLSPAFVGHISEAAPAGSLVAGEGGHSPLVLRALDRDRDANALLAYRILEPEAARAFRVDPSMGTLSSVGTLDHESTPSFRFRVHVHDQGRPVLLAPAPAWVVVKVRDVNDAPPRFSERLYEAAVLGPTHPGMELLTVQAHDPDSEVTYSVRAGNADGAVAVHPCTGRVSVLRPGLLGRGRELTLGASDGPHQDTARLRVTVTPAPNSSLHFERSIYSAAVREDAPDAEALLTLGVQGRLPNDTLAFVLLNGTDLFRVVRSAGVLLTRGVALDREQQDTHVLAVELRDDRAPPRVARALVRVSVQDANDHRPEFQHLPYTAVVPDGTEPGDVLLQVSATDRDTGPNGAVTYAFVEDYPYFRLDPYLGDISLRKPLDHQALDKYRLEVVARDGGAPALQAAAEVLVVVRNGSHPLFQSPSYRVRVPEGLPPHTPVLHAQARSPEGHRLIYSVAETPGSASIAVDSRTGVLTVTGPLDYESVPQHVLTVRATDTARGAFSEAVVEVLLEDVNDNAPTFPRRVYAAAVPEGQPAPTPVIRLLASDRDSGRNRDVAYQIVEDGSDVSSFFQIDGRTGEMTTVQELDYEARQHFRVAVRAVDGGDPPLTGETLVEVSVSDINDNPPVFRQAQYEASVSELATCGHLVLKVQALDPDGGDSARLQYLILSGNRDRHFSIDGSSGIISMVSPCHKPLGPAYSLRVAASDGVFRASVPVYINTTGANRHSPEFQQRVYEAELAENAAVGTQVIELLATDRDSGPYGAVDYTIINKLAGEKFSISPGGRVATRQQLDRENATERVIAIKVAAQDGGGRVGFCTVNIILTDENDNRPQFRAAEYTVSVPADAAKDSPVIRVLAHDADEGRNADVTYSVDPAGGPGREVVEVSPTTGVVKVKESLAGLEHRALDLKIKAQDGGPPHWDSLLRLRLQVVPREAPLPQFSEPLYAFSAAEDLPVGAEVGFVRALADPGPVIYSLVPGTTPESNRDGVFSLDRSTGRLTVRKALDYESTRWYQMDLMAHRPHNSTFLASLVSVSVQVRDVNDNRPAFEADPYKAVLAENMPAGTSVIQVTANDQDTGDGGRVSYRLPAGPGSDVHGLFAIDAETGWITTLQELDCEARQAYRFHVVAHDHGQPVQLSSQVLVEVTVTDENDNPPRFAPEAHRGSVVENGKPGEPVATLRVLDDDVAEQNRQVSCYITEGDPLGHFGIDRTGDEWKVVSRTALDRELMAKYLLRVTASDGKFQASALVEVSVLDVNDNSPQCGQPLYSGSVREDAPPGHPILKVSASDADADANAQITFSLHGPGADAFQMDARTGELTTLAALDRERQDTYVLVAKATDGGGRSCQADVSLQVRDVNDNPPRFSPGHCAVAVFYNTTVRTPVAVVLAQDPDQGTNAQVVYSLTDSAEGRFSIEATTGVIRLEKPLQAGPQAALELTVRASDLGTPIPLSTLGTVTVSVVGLDDYLPAFLSPEHSVQVPEDARRGTEVLRLSSLTRPAAHRAGYRLLSGNEQGSFRLDTHTGVLYVDRSLDFETSPTYFLSVECSREGASPLSDVATVMVNVTDVNEHRPRFPRAAYSAGVLESAAAGEVVLRVSATDEDGPLNSAVTYSLVGGNELGHFAVHPAEGALWVAGALDREQTPSYTLRLRATDSGRPPLHEDADVAVQVLDVNDNPPRFFQLNYSASVQESCPVGSRVLQLVLSDPDSPENGPPYSFRITRGNDGAAFRVTPDGWLVTAAGLSQALQGRYQLQVEVRRGRRGMEAWRAPGTGGAAGAGPRPTCGSRTPAPETPHRAQPGRSSHGLACPQAWDSGVPPLSSSTAVSVLVAERSRYPPSALPLEVFITVGEGEFLGGLVGKIHATDRDPQDTLTFSLAGPALDGHFSVGAADGAVLAARGLPCGHYAFNVSVSDGTFAAWAGVQVHVWRAGREALQRALWLGFGQLGPEELVSEHWRNLQRFLGHQLGARRARIRLASLQPAEAAAGVDVLLVFEGHSGNPAELQELAATLARSARDMEQALGLQMRAAVPVAPCRGPGCQDHACRDAVQLDAAPGPAYSTARLSVLTPRHRLLQSCVCNGTAARFSGQSFGRYRPAGAQPWHIRFRLRTLQSQAVVLSSTGASRLSLQLRDGALRLEHHCPGGFHANLSSPRRVSDQQWHWVHVEEAGNATHLWVDGAAGTALLLADSCRGPAPQRDLLLGGLAAPGAPVQLAQGFQGCLDEVTVNGEPLALLAPEGAGGLLEARGLSPCCPQGGPCSQKPCLHGGLCTQTPGAGYVCTCAPQFSGRHCEQRWENCSSKAPCPEGVACTSAPGGGTCACPHPHTGGRCESEAQGCAEGLCLVTPAIRRGDWGLQEALLVTLVPVLAVAAAVGLLLCCRRYRQAHKPVAAEDPDLLARSVGVDTQAAPAVELSPLGPCPRGDLGQGAPGKAGASGELGTFGPSSKQRPVVCSVPPRLPPAALPARTDHTPAVKRTWSGENVGYPGAAAVWPPTYARKERWECAPSEVTPYRHQPPVLMPEPPGLYGGFPFPLELGDKRAPLPPRYSNQNLEDLLPPRPPSPRERLLAPRLQEYTAVSYYQPQPRPGAGGPCLLEGGYKGVSVRLSRAGPSYADGEAGGRPPSGRGPLAPPDYEGSDQAESDYGSCEEVMF